MNRKSWLEDGPNGLKINFSKLLEEEQDHRDTLLRFVRALEREVSQEVEVNLGGTANKQVYAQTIRILNLHFTHKGITLKCTNIPEIWRDPKGVLYLEGEGSNSQ